MSQLYSNNAVTALSAAITVSATTLTVANGAVLPALTAGDYFLVTLIGLNVNGAEAKWEIVKVIARSSNTLTVVRGQEGTTAQAWPNGTLVEARLTAGTLSNLVERVAGKQLSTEDFTSALLTKLDAIEAGATGDQTAAEILALLKTVDGAGSGIDADTLDGQDGSYYLNASNLNAGTIPIARVPTLNQSTTGNAGTATKLATPRAINGVLFDGSGDISVNSNLNQLNQSGATVDQVPAWNGTAWAPRDIPETYRYHGSLGTASLDDIRAPGLWGQSVAATATVARSYPVEGVPGALEVLTLNPDTTPYAITAQRYTTNEGTQRIFIRRGGAQGGWGGWVQSVLQGDSVSPSRYDLASASVTSVLDLATSQVFRVDASAPRTLAFANAPGANRAMTVVVHITGNSAVSWPAGIDWDSGAAPELGDTFTRVVLMWDGAGWTGFAGAQR